MVSDGCRRGARLGFVVSIMTTSDRQLPGGLPLCNRLPNVPLACGQLVTFPQHKEASAQLRRAIEASPLAVLTGPTGIGKTTVLLQTLHEMDAEQVERCVYVKVEPGDGIAQAVFDIIRALCMALGRDTPDWPTLFRGMDAALALAIDLSEAYGAWVVIEDLDGKCASEFLSFCRALGRYARRSRWLVTTARQDWPDDELCPGQVVRLEPLPCEPLIAMARRRGGARDERRVEAVKAQCACIEGRLCGGIPGRLVELLDEYDIEALNDDDAETLEPWLDLLTVCECPLPEQVFEAPTPDAGAVDILGSPAWQRAADTFLIERSPAGWQLRRKAKDAWTRRRGAAALLDARQRACEFLARCDDLEVIVERLRLLLAVENHQGARELLGEHGEDLLGQGYAARLWECLEPVEAAELQGWRLRSAERCGSPQALQALVPMCRRWRCRNLDDPEAEYAVASILYLTNYDTEAREQIGTFVDRLREQRQHGEVDDDLWLRSVYLLANASFVLGDSDDAMRVIEELDADSARHRCFRVSFLASHYAALSQRAHLLSLCDEVELILADVRPDDAMLVASNLVRALCLVGELGAAASLGEKVWRMLQPKVLSQRRGRSLLRLLALVALERGRLVETRRTLDRLEPCLANVPRRRVYLLLYDTIRRFYTGNLDGLRAALDDCERVAREFGHHGIILQVSLHRTLLDIARGNPPADGDLPEGTLYGPDGRMAVRLVRLTQAARHGHTVELDDFVEDELAVRERVRFLLLAAQQEALAGRAGRAFEFVGRALSFCTSSQLGLLELEARLVECEVLTMQGRDVATAANDLLALAERLGSERFRGEAEFFLWASRAPTSNGPRQRIQWYARLATLAQTHDRHPVAARRAGALLGGDPPLDAVDAAVLREVRRRSNWQTPQPVSLLDFPDPPLSWGLYHPAWCVWTERGDVVCLQDRQIEWSLLVELSRRGGYLTKEQLLSAVWKIDDYHPLRHDNRLRLAVRKLRKRIEVDPSSPEILLTHADGYALGGRLLVVDDD